MLTLGKTGITTPQNAFGALPIQRVDMETAKKILMRAYEGGMRYFDTARAYTDSEEKLGETFSHMRDKIYIASKTMSRNPEGFWKDLETSLKLLKTDYIDVYQFHCADTVYAPDDGFNMYECMLKAKEEGKIRHIGITAHKIGIAEDAVKSGLYETLQFPFSYISGERETKLVKLCEEHNVGFVCMKGLAGGLITNSKAAMAFTAQFKNALPIWGIQKMSELEEWLSYMDNVPKMTDEIREFIKKEKEELAGNFCRSCGYCMPCPVGITINQCARMSLMLRRAPSKMWLTDYWQAEMKKIENCLHCNKCMSHCPYELNTPELLAKNYEDYKKVLAGEIKVQ
ncbi:MAG: aldo/keto reductase [Selenomonadaceae bacterium]|nr:aldo/keto reductase [Selenomonadaceae bacterium]MBR3722727.1 aldo/keto reductase [Selenomonadaceae bacterium]